jgi:FtsH-binding integral membrane protein
MPIAQDQYGQYGQPGNQYGGNTYGGDYGDSGKEEIPMGIPLDGQTPPDIRSDFVKKVYSILSVQLLVTFGIAFFVNDFVGKNPTLAGGIYILAMVGLVSTMCVLCCCADLMRKFPINYGILSLITVAMSCVVGIVTAQYKTESVLLAVATTALIFFCLTAYACITKTDWTGMGPYLAAGLMALIAFGFMLQIFCWFGMCPGPLLHKLYAGAGVLIFTMYIVYDTQMIVGGTHAKHQYTIDDYAFAALNLYLDIINLFIYLLQLFGERCD